MKSHVHFFLLLVILKCTSQFNLDTQSVHVVKSNNGLFGFTVALHKSSSENLLLVGSPNADTDQEGVIEGGALFKCPIPRLNEIKGDAVDCSSQIEIFNDGGNEYYSLYGDVGQQNDFYVVPAQNKSHQFLGVALQASDSHVVVCAHRFEYRYWLQSYIEDLPRQLVGRCLVANRDFDDLEVRELMPCDNGDDSGYESYGYCEAGIAASLSGNDLVMGAPGRHKSLGGAFLIDLDSFSDATEEMTRIPEPANDNEMNKYVGYSSVICNMDKDDSNGMEIILGGPRGSTYKGEVKIFSKMRTEYTDQGESRTVRDFDKFQNSLDPNFDYTFSGEQMGSYFGHSLACTDVNGDGLDDLIVGAPWYTEYNGDILADTGRIYVLYGSDYLDDTDLLENPMKITGKQGGAAFGFSLASAGDMNEDSYMDVFVGAPYHDNGQGAVFLYLGSETGLQTEYSQLIKPSVLNVQDGLTTFGWSIAGGRDMDGNGYNDVVIGAYQSGHATFIRSKSIIRVNPTLDFLFTKFNKTRQVTNLQVCMEYEANLEGEPLTTDSLPVIFKIKLDTGDGFSRLSFLFEDGGTGSVWGGKLDVSTAGLSKACTSPIDIAYDNSTGNVQPMPVSFEASLDDVLGLSSLILDQGLIKAAEKDLTIQSNCHPESGVCNVDMKIAVADITLFDEQDIYPDVVFSYVKTITKEITVSNIGTADLYNYAYDIVVNITLPDLVKFNDYTGEYMAVDDKGSYVEVHLLNEGPINEESVRVQKISLTFDISLITEVTDLMFGVEAVVNNPTEDSDLSNNVVVAVVHVGRLADLVINGGSNRARVPFNNQYTVVNRAIGSPEVIIRHDYLVSLSDYSVEGEIPNITVNIYWPQQVTEQKLFIVPLYNVTVRTHNSVQHYCTYDTSTWYPYVETKKSLALDESLVLPLQERETELPESVDCATNPELCKKITCNFDRILSGESYTHGFKMSLRGRVHEANLYDSEGITLTSHAVIAGAGELKDAFVLPIKHSASATSELYPSKITSQNLLWIIIGSVIGGLLFLVLIVIVLWKCGFFKRRQPPAVRADKVDEEVEMKQLE